MQYLTIIPGKLPFDSPHVLRETPYLTSDTYNFFEFFGTLATRDGFQNDIAIPSTSFIGCFTFISADGLYQLILADYTTMWSSDSSDYGAIVSLLGANPNLLNYYGYAWNFAPGTWVSNTGFIATNWVNQPISWSVGDTSWAVLANAPVARAVTVLMEGVAGYRAVFGNTYESNVDYPSRVRWSKLNDITTYPATAYADITSTDDNIVAVRQFSQGTIVIYKENSQWIGQANVGSDAAAIVFTLVDRAQGL